MCTGFIIAVLGLVGIMPFYFLSVEHQKLQRRYGKEKGNHIGEILGIISGWSFFTFWIGIWISPQPRFTISVFQDSLIMTPVINFAIPLFNLASCLLLILPGSWLAINGVKETTLKARARGLQKSKLVPIEDIDFRPNSFDTILMMGNNFGLFGNLKKAKSLLKRFHRMTSKDALIIASSRDPYKTDNLAHLQYHKMNRRKGRMSGQVKIRIRYEKYKARARSHCSKRQIYGDFLWSKFVQKQIQKM